RDPAQGRRQAAPRPRRRRVARRRALPCQSWRLPGEPPVGGHGPRQRDRRSPRRPGGRARRRGPRPPPRVSRSISCTTKRTVGRRARRLGEMGNAAARDLVDPFGRVVRDLRISVTDRCNFRCTYCMPEEGLPWVPQDEILTFEEIERLARICVERFGFGGIRLTGGEPTLRAHITRLVEKLAGLGV